MSEMQIFDNSNFGRIRTIDENGKILFCGSDVAKALGYKDVYKAIKQHCKKDGWVNHPVTDSLGRKQNAKFINEGNLYRLIVSSKLPSAEQFETWVFDEVLPEIRRNGHYNKVGESVDLTIENRIAIAKLLASTPNSRLPLVKQVLMPVIGELPEITFTTQRLSALKKLTSILMM